MTQLYLFRKEIEDVHIRENFKRLMDYTNESPLNKGGFKFFEIIFDAPKTNFRFKHNLGFQPLDILLTHVSMGATVTWNYDLFDRNFLDITTSGATRLRFFAGGYAE